MNHNGIHHVTAIAGPARRNLDFYTHTLGLRLVKRTVNFDDLSSYHFYYGDETGRPGTILTFFPWEHAAPGRGGVGQAQETAFRVPEGAIGFWAHRLVEHGVRHEAPAKRWPLPYLEVRARKHVAQNRPVPIRRAENRDPPIASRVRVVGAERQSSMSIAGTLRQCTLIVDNGAEVRG